MHLAYFSLFATILPKITKIGGNWTKFCQKEICTVFSETRCSIFSGLSIFLTVCLLLVTKHWMVLSTDPARENQPLALFFLDPLPERKGKERKGKEEYLYSAILVCMHTLKPLRHGSYSFTCKLHHASPL